MTAERLAAALDAAGLNECPKCHGLFHGPHRCYEDTFDALLARIGVGKTEASSQWSLSAVLSSHTGYEYTVVLNRNFSGAQGKGRAAVGIAFSTPVAALAAAIKMAGQVDAHPAAMMDDSATAAWLAEPEA